MLGVCFVGSGAVTIAAMGIPTTTIVGSNNMHLVGSSQQMQV